LGHEVVAILRSVPLLAQPYKIILAILPTMAGVHSLNFTQMATTAGIVFVQ
jgi:hypothetical protein